MLLELLIVLTIFIFVFFFIKLGKEWYAPYTLFGLPFIAMFVIALLNKEAWGLDLNFITFMIFFIGFLFFMFGCWFARHICLSKSVLVTNSLKIKPRLHSVNTTRLFILDLIMLVFFMIFFLKIYTWGKENGFSLSGAINEIMVLSKFEPDKVTVTIPFIIQIFLQINYLAAYLYSFFIARRIVFKDRSNLFLLLFGYGISMATCFLNGSRGPLVENLIAIVIAFAICWHQRYGQKMFPRKILGWLFVLTIVAAVGFFAIIPLLGREKTAESLIDQITEYIGAQVYNLNYFVETSDARSTFFAANTLGSFYNDLKTLGIDLGASAHTVKSFFVTANGHEMGNVFTCFFSFYVDFGLVGVGILSFFMGWVSMKVFDKIKTRWAVVDFAFVVYLYIAVNLIFSFFGPRFFQNVVQIKSLLKFIWLYFIFWFVYGSDIKVMNYADGLCIYQGVM